MSDNKVFFASGEDEKMIAAFEKAQQTFKYYWREISWEYRRIIPALDVCCVKVAFSQTFEGEDEPTVEHMWINDVDFNGEIISGTLVNEPNELTNVENGDEVKIPLSQISDWLFAIAGKTFGGFTIQAMRSSMSSKELKEHDKAWGLNFGDFNDILIVNKQKENPENLIEHPMSKNMGESLREYLTQNPKEVNEADEDGITPLHEEAVKGNLTSIEILLSFGANKNAKTNNGFTALDLAKKLNWEHIITSLEN